MKKLIVLMFMSVLVFSCEKDAILPIESDSIETTIDVRNNDISIQLIIELINTVSQMISNNEIPSGSGQSILSKLNNIKKKLEQGKINVAMAQLDALLSQLAELIIDGVLEEDIGEEIITDIEGIECDVDPNCENCDSDCLFCAYLNLFDFDLYCSENITDSYTEYCGEWIYNEGTALLEDTNLEVGWIRSSYWHLVDCGEETWNGYIEALHWDQSSSVIVSEYYWDDTPQAYNLAVYCASVIDEIGTNLGLTNCLGQIPSLKESLTERLQAIEKNIESNPAYKNLPEEIRERLEGLTQIRSEL